MTGQPKFEFQFDELVLWRDGGRAVVSMALVDRLGRNPPRWVRVLEADVAELFHESCNATELKALSWKSAMAGRENRWRAKRVPRPGVKEEKPCRKTLTTLSPGSSATRALP